MRARVHIPLVERGGPTCSDRQILCQAQLSASLSAFHVFSDSPEMASSFPPYPFYIMDEWKPSQRQKPGRKRNTNTQRELSQGFCGVWRGEEEERYKVLSVWMEMVRVSFFFFSLVAILAIAVLPAINAQNSPAPAPASDGLSQKTKPHISFLLFSSIPLKESLH